MDIVAGRIMSTENAIDNARNQTRDHNSFSAVPHPRTLTPTTSKERVEFNKNII
jgi:hypothetical protein